VPEPQPPAITELDARNAKPPPRFEVNAPKGAPNVVVVLLDDIGFGQPSTFGGPCKMPTLDKLAADGLRYNGFHTAALCSPTRTALLTGRNHQVNNEVLHLANQGVGINEIQNVYHLPKSLEQNWAAHSYHGSEAHNSRAVINRYLGYWDANPATLIPLSPCDSAPLYVEMMGGSAKIMTKGKELYDQGKYLYAVEILNKLVFAEPKNQPAKDLLADTYEQIGYQQESPSVRNTFLAGTYELRNGIPKGASPKSSGPDMVTAMSTELWLDFLGIRLDESKVESKHFVINFVTPDNDEKYVVELSNSTLTNIKGQQAKKPELTITMNRTDLEAVMMGKATFDDQIKNGKAKLVGNREPYDLLKNSLTQFNTGFQVLPGTGGTSLTAPKDPFEQEAPAIQSITD
jgi:alkyl sulfatase BDS1-like metallo-beta-lactamase superfamily hydrolase